MHTDIAKLIKPYLRPGKKHNVLILPGRRRTGIPKTPSDWRAIRNLRAQLNRMQAAELAA